MGRNQNPAGVEEGEPHRYWKRQNNGCRDLLVFGIGEKKMLPEQNLYPNLKPAVLFISTVPFSNVNVERFFSAVKAVKTDR